ncbi:hypothetical protein [Paraburkholderia sp. GAS199]|uniref:hypothetical protein n=1 Tax=Paraburkholderia sp. GAS199 TaxID=3035126 RepID=UPI003D1F136E
MTPVAPCDDAYFMSVKLRPMSSGRMWLGERLVSNLQMQLRLFATCFAHLSDQPHSEMLEPFDLVRFHVPRSTLKQFIDDQGSKQIDALRCPKP